MSPFQSTYLTITFSCATQFADSVAELVPAEFFALTLILYVPTFVIEKDALVPPTDFD